MMLNYQETLQLVESFMRESGIRSFCSEVCRGQCCRRCKDRCQEPYGKRLACSAFICGSIRLQFPQSAQRTYAEFYQTMISTIRNLDWEINEHYRNSHYAPIDKEVARRFCLDPVLVNSALAHNIASDVSSGLDLLRRRLSNYQQEFDFLQGAISARTLDIIDKTRV